MGEDALIETVGYGTEFSMGPVKVSLHPAGHILGFVAVRVEHKGEVWVVSGDYKVFPDRTCTPFEPVRCHTFVTESTFGMPIYRWPDPALSPVRSIPGGARIRRQVVPACFWGMPSGKLSG